MWLNKYEEISQIATFWNLNVSVANDAIDNIFAGSK